MRSQAACLCLQDYVWGALKDPWDCMRFRMAWALALLPLQQTMAYLQPDTQNPQHNTLSIALHVDHHAALPGSLPVPVGLSM
jgi:hypothetical protein